MTPRAGYHHGDLRNALEQAALELVAERGPQGFSLAEASRRAGVSAAAPFRHFANREALLAALAMRSYEEQRVRFARAAGGAADPIEQLARFASAYVGFAVEQQALFDVTFGAGLVKREHPGLEEAGQRVLDVLRAPAEQLRAEPAAALELIHTIAATAHGFAAFLREGVLTDRARAEVSAAAAARVLAHQPDQRLPS
ncbi:TetR/AcrR family transcriptional regulator [Kribbella sandramycini]|uniref:AcrR family transcriptional regulator n=1 Tax=Kribbella sandramycini TaxID=60450 RepID=A0A7Y4NZA7_9ACTN|nr:TetR/AcrR family transcriptional regulator [Kribbella sandramycini]MBB6567598.1 AcrR family transcriptional regulator [Kribbella sandramycini]NOL39799.1 TetR/AcrR family transcriptional regulator [Kribbella sandramycini]